MINLTEEQQEIVDEINKQVYDPDGHNLIISAQGGTGKTTLICEIICDLLENNKRVWAAAFTGKATAVLREKIERALFDRGKALPAENMLMIETISTLTKRARVIGIDSTGDTLFQNTWQDPAKCPYDVIFIDELSMVPQWVVEWWIKCPARVFAFGDWAQLPEIGGQDSEDDFKFFKKSFSSSRDKWIAGYGIKLLKNAKTAMTKVLRSDNEIALMCNDLRKTWMTKKEYIDTIKTWANKAKNCISYSRSMADIKMDKDWQIICYTNKMCQRINEKLCIGQGYPDLEDKIIVNDNVNPVKIYNGNIMTLKQFREQCQEYNKQRVDEGKSPVAVCVKWQGQMPNINSKNPYEKEYAMTYRYYRNQFDSVQKRRLVHLPEIMKKVFADKTYGISEAQGNQLITRIKRLIASSNQLPEKTFKYALDIINNINYLAALAIMDASEQLPRLYMVNLDYGYAITTHKSQGSQYEKVCYLLERFDRPLLYTAVSRAEKEVAIIDLT